MHNPKLILKILLLFSFLYESNHKNKEEKKSERGMRGLAAWVSPWVREEAKGGWELDNAGIVSSWWRG